MLQYVSVSQDQLEVRGAAMPPSQLKSLEDGSSIERFGLNRARARIRGNSSELGGPEV